MADATPETEGPSRLAGGGPSGKGPLVRAARAKQPDLKKVASYWLNRFDAEKYSAQAELIELIMAVADVPSQTTVAKEDMKDQAPSAVVDELTSALALEASEKGADFSQHWLVSRDKGATRTRENYPAIWRELASAPSPETLLKDVLPRLRAWTLALAECRFRSIRHCATVAGLGLVDGLQQQCNEIQGFCDTAERRLAETEVEATRAQISQELKRQRQLLKNLLDARDSFAATLLSRRCKDVDSDIRYSCIEALNRWAQLRGEASWKQYLHFAINDEEAKVRAAALLALQPLFRTDDGPLRPEVKSIAEDLRSRILERCHDLDASVSAAALRCACDLAKAEVLKEEDYDRIIDLVWDPEAPRREGACIFAMRFVLQEDIIDRPNGPAAGSAAKRQLEMLLDFLVEWAMPHFDLTERLVASLWRKASCLEDWDAMTGLLLGDGDLTAEQHVAIAFLAEATIRVAFDEWLAKNTIESEALLQRAARALCPRLPALLSTFQSEKAAMPQAASLCNYLLRFCAESPPGPTGGLLAGSAGEPVARALRGPFLRQTDLEALEHLALAWAHLLQLCSGARPVLHDLVKSLHDTFLQLAPLIGKPSQGDLGEAEVPMPDTLLATAQRLRILAKCYDVSLCDVEGFVSAALSAVDERVQGGTVETELTVTLMELLALISLRHAAQLMQPPLPAVAADVRDERQLQQASTAAEDLLELATGFLTKDEDQRLKSAAFGVALCTLSAWWNAAHFGRTEEVKPWFCQLPETLQDALAHHLGQLLTEANQVPIESVLVSGMPEPGDLLKSSAFSHLFVLLQKGAASVESVPSDAERIKTARLCCLMVASCRHPQVAAGSLPSVVLSQARSRREDLQQVAWTLLRRARREAHVGPTQAEDFFATLLAAVKFLHKEEGTAIAKDLSFRLLQHVGVGKLTPALQKALLSTLRRAISNASSGSAGFLEALTPWITKHVVEDVLIQNLASWAKEQSNEALQEAGLDKLLEACESTVKKTGDPDTPEKPSKRRRITKGGNRKTPVSTQEIKDVMELP